MNFGIESLEKLHVLEALKACDFDLSSDKLHINFSKFQAEDLVSASPNSSVTLQLKRKQRARFKAGSELSASVNLMSPDSTDVLEAGEELISFTIQYSLKVDLKDIQVEKG